MFANPFQAPSSSDDDSAAGRLKMRQWIVIGAVCIVSLCLRLIDSPIANLSSMAALALFSGTVLRHPAGLLLPLGIRALTDSLIHLKTGYGFFPSWPFDYSAYALIWLIGLNIPRTGRWNIGKRIVAVLGGTIASVLVYFLLSNFGVWLLWPETYPRTAAGLLDCFVKAIPFARGTILGNLIAAPAFYWAWFMFACPVATPTSDEATIAAAQESH